MSQIISPDEFSIQVKKRAKQDNDTIFNTLMDMCEEHDIPVEDVRPYLTDVLMKDLEGEGIRLNLVKQRSRTKRILK